MSQHYTLDDYKSEIKGDLSDATITNDYNRIICLYRKLYGFQETVVRKQLVDMLNDPEKVIEFLRHYKLVTAKGYAQALMTFAVATGVDSTPYIKYFNENNKRVRQLMRMPVMTDDRWQELQKSLDVRISNLPKGCERMCDKMEYQRTILMVIMLRLPARKNEDIQVLRYGPSGHSTNYYDSTNHSLVYRENGDVTTKVFIPQEYHPIFDKYTEHMPTGSHLFFTERKQEEYTCSNLSVFGKKIFGVDLVSIRNKWKDMIISMSEGEEREKLIEWL